MEQIFYQSKAIMKSAVDPPCLTSSPSRTHLPTGETGQGSTIAVSLFANTIIEVTVPHFHDPQ